MTEEDIKVQLVKMKELLKEKDRLIETLLLERDAEVIDLRKSYFEKKCDKCENLKEKWKKIHKNFQEVPNLLQAMINRTNKLFEDDSIDFKAKSIQVSDSLPSFPKLDVSIDLPKHNIKLNPPSPQRFFGSSFPEFSGSEEAKSPLASSFPQYGSPVRFEN